MKYLIYKQKYSMLRCLMFMLFMNLMAANQAAYGQGTVVKLCGLDIDSGMLMFNAYGQEHTVTIRGNATSGLVCPYQIRPNSAFQCTQSDGGATLRIKLKNNFWSVTNPTIPSSIVLLDASNPKKELSSIVVLVEIKTQALNGGKIHFKSLVSSETKVIETGSSPGLAVNSIVPYGGGGSGTYTYQWQQAELEQSLSDLATPVYPDDTGLSDGYLWKDIPGATGLSYQCPPAMSSKVFRRMVAIGTQKAASNIVTAYTRNTTKPNLPVNMPEPTPSEKSIPSAGENYILTRTMQHESGKVFLDDISYFDGLGRLVQTVSKGVSPSKKDIVTLQEYDAAGREGKAWLPTPVTGKGGYVSPASFKTESASFYSDGNPYNKPVYELSPLNRITEQYGPGSAWHSPPGKPVKTGYLANSASGELECALYAVAGETSLKRAKLYDPGELFVVRTADEDGKTSYVFTDKLGQTVLTRVMDGTAKHDTYYVHDDFGNLRYVLPPQAADALKANSTWNDTDDNLKKYAYIYKYDVRNRCIEKKLPGCDPVRMKYDKADRLVFSSDGVQAKGNQWTFHLYDAFGRETVSGTCVGPDFSTLANTAVQTSFTGNRYPMEGYSVNLALPEGIKLLTVNYYDGYSFLEMLSPLDKICLGSVYVSGYGNVHANAKGLVTGRRVFNAAGGGISSISSIYYDDRGRVVQTHGDNHRGGFDDEYFVHDFTGRIIQRMLVHSVKNSLSQVETYAYGYDTAGRLSTVTHKLDGSPSVAMAAYKYDEIGRIKEKEFHGKKDTLSYAYNVRSWLTQITGSKFNQTLTYNAAVNGVTPAKALYNGNISAMKWKSGDEATERGYKFTYDGIGRLTKAAYGEGNAITTNPGRFNEAVTYNDKMGNIKTLQRQGKITPSTYGLMDNLTYAYSGNRLTKVTDAVTTAITNPDAFHFVDGANAANEYAYDANGNITQDLNKKITSITYNSLNLPSAMTFSDGNTTTYGYDAAGSKLSVAYKSGGTTAKTEYVGNKVYKNGTLSMILTEEGYITLSGTTPTYYYYLRGHQGNNRVVLNQAGAVQQVNHYYPFGGIFGEGLQSSKQPYKYNGKELDRQWGLDMYDYGARHYDAALGRWFTVDPRAEDFYIFSPYVYCYNNPLRYIDPDGKSGRSISRVRHLPRMYKAYKTARTVEGVGFWAAVGTAFTSNQFVSGDRSEEVRSALIANITTTTAVTSELNKNLPPDPGWLRRQGKSAEEWAAAQLAGHGALMTGGHNPKDPGGDFNPDPNIEPKKGHKTLASVLAGAVGVSQIMGDQDARKDVKETESTENQTPQIDPSEIKPTEEKNIFQQIWDKWIR